MATFEDAVAATRHLAGVEVSTSYGTPALKVRGKTFARVWGPRDRGRANVDGAQVLVVWCDPDEKRFLLAEEPALFTTPHYDAHASVLVRLDLVDAPTLARLLADAYAEVAAPTTRKRAKPS
ncbi:MAG TPA: MmcQ/YjbR family DNA-binding protein [Acidimicrobiales bacterium]|nr:MmcQ/YjbR family DNA-binding protein [Acidimicrobiales bacterium]